MKWENLLSLKRQVNKEEEPSQFLDYPISEFEKDYQSIISSSAFRRLQDKTQVFPLDKSDFVRTRLTHSIEVSTIARQLGIMVTDNKSRYLKEEFKKGEKLGTNIPMVLSCAGLLHDIGNPPFGHFGEAVIGDWFKEKFSEEGKKGFCFKGNPIADLLNDNMKNDLMNFEGNAQALRILSKIKNNNTGYDINLSYSVLNTLIKYPTSSVEFNSKDINVRKHKLGYFYAERETMHTICNITETNIDGEYVRHPLTFLMEAADDIAYATADLEDAFKKGLFTLQQFIEYLDGETKKSNVPCIKYTKELLKNLEERLINSFDSESELAEFQKWMELVRKWLMYAVSYSFSKNYDDILAGKYKHDMFYETNHEETIKILKKAMKKFVFNNKEILKLELAAKKIIGSLLDDFIYSVIYWQAETDAHKLSGADKKYVSIISENYKEDYKHAKTDNDFENLYLRFLMVTDYISGMTDSFAKNLYQELNGIN